MYRVQVVHRLSGRDSHTLRNGLRSWKNSLSTFAALCRQHTLGDLAPVVQARVGNNLIKTFAAAGLGVVRTVDQALDPGQDDCAGAHDAGLERHVEDALFEPPGAERSAGPGQGQALGVGSRVVQSLAQVVSLRDHSTGTHHEGTDRNLTEVSSLVRQFERRAIIEWSNESSRAPGFAFSP